ncbi:MAG: hypothetical protein HKN04_04755 [Rhodothermaceae bacterium]|nr:hypothetical protein [Rhodothermaceae bacterium]
MKLVFALHAVATLAMFGAIWIVQLVHYPLFSGVGEAGWTAYEGQHQTRITWIVGPLMVVELVTAVWLVFERPPFVPTWMALLGVLLVGVIWLSTAFVQVPLHNTLSQGFDATAHQRLVATNWIRTVAWSLRAGLVSWFVYRLVP